MAQRLEIISAEAAINMRGLRDFLVGTLAAGEAKSLAPLAELQNAKRSVLDALREKARELGADAVVRITIRYDQLGAGINMLLVAATGTAVRLAGPTENPQTRTEPSEVHEPVNIPVYTFDPSPDDGHGNLA